MHTSQAPLARRVVGSANVQRHTGVSSTTLRLQIRWGRVTAILLLVAVITVFSQALQWPAASATNESVSVNFNYVTVHAGDSLWALAEKYAPQADPREWINQVAQINNLSSSGLVAGQQLAIPGK